jgi:TonB-linked SusC/RagA family outer membrane protein
MYLQDDILTLKYSKCMENIQLFRRKTIRDPYFSLTVKITLIFLFFHFNFVIASQHASEIEISDKIEEKSESEEFTLTGLLTDAEGNPVVGATISVKDSGRGVVSNIDGRYSIKVREGEVLEYRLVGYNTEERTVKQGMNGNLRMTESSVSLDDIVVIAYGQQKKESVVSSLNTIGTKELSIPNRNLTNNLAGQIAGVIAIQRSGEPGNDDAEFWIRGQSSYAGGTSPLVLVDGVPRRMNDIDVDEIETFTVLKDAAATAVYGAEGANGVVLITSKRGKSQKTSVSFNTHYSIVTPARMPELLDSYNYLRLYNEAKWNEVGNPASEYIPYYDEATLEKYRTGEDPDLYPNSNWMDLLSDHTQSQRYTLNFRGGSERVKFFVSGAYYSENGIFKSNSIDKYDANIGLERYNLRSNVDLKLTGTTDMTVDMSSQYVTRQTPGNSSDKIFGVMTKFPTHIIPTMYSDGTFSEPGNYDVAHDRANPYNLLNHTGYSKYWNVYLQSKVSLNQKLDFITNGLSAKVIISLDADFASILKRVKTPETFYATGRDADGVLIKNQINPGTALGDPELSDRNGSKKIYLETSVNYNRTFADKHDVTGMVLYMQKETQYQNRAGVELLPYRKQSIVGRATYGYDNRYMLEASFGATGSENFMKGYRWGIFPAVGAAWFVSHEEFMKPVENLLSKLKFRASYGMTGNDAMQRSADRFTYRESFKTNNDGYQMGLTPGVGGGTTNEVKNGITEENFSMPSLTWEKERKVNMGVDVGLFRGRVDITVDYFSNRRNNILISRYTIPTAAGFRKNPTQNFGITTNKGFDGTVVLKQSIGNVNLSARGNITYAKSKILEKDEVPQLYSYQSETGRVINSRMIYVAEGLYTPDDFDITTNPTTGAMTYTLKSDLPTPGTDVKPGDIKYKNLNNDDKIDEADRTREHGFFTEDPEVVYGFGLNVEWKGIYAGIFFQGTGNTSTNLIASAAGFIPFYAGVDASSARVEALDRWQAADPYNQNVLYPRLYSVKNDHNLRESTWWYRDASFLRLKNLEFGYEFDRRLIQKLKINSLRVYVQGTNVAVWDNIKYWDPELGNSNSGAKYPITGTWTIGLDITL